MDDLNNIQMQHQFELSADALNDFVTQLDETLDTSNQSFQETFEEFLEGLRSVISTASIDDFNDGLNALTNGLLGTSASIKVDDSQTGKLATGTSTKLTTSVYTTMTQEDFIESLSKAIRTDIVPVISTTNNKLRQETSYLQDISTTLQENLNKVDPLDNVQKMSQVVTTDIVSYLQKIAENTKYGKSETEQGNVTVTLNYDSLLSVQGSVDSTVVKDLETKLQKCSDDTVDRIYKELSKIGMKRTY